MIKNVLCLLVFRVCLLSLPHRLLSVASRYDGEREAGDEEAERGGGQAERRDQSQRPRAHAEERGHRSSKMMSHMQLSHVAAGMLELK